jgi:hypothetical protein
MPPNLSLEHLALTLAALTAACTRAEPSLRTDQTPMTAPSSFAAAPPPPPAEAEPDKKIEGEKEPAPKTVATATATASARPMASPKRRMGGDKGQPGQASCGAGTCTADPKKK